MTIGSSLFLIAVGAILRYAITRDTWHAINIDTVGLILIIVGVVGLILGLYMYFVRGRRAVVVDDEPVAVRRRPVDY
jgi:asparagine N-glycosylation enzyme membrane subunit Stt3